MSMLRLQSETREEWTRVAVENIDEILIDHAHCEKKAASTALTLIFRYPEYAHMMKPLSAVAREELEHFEEVVGHLERRGVQFRRLAPSQYAGRLMTVVRSGEPNRLIDMLLCCAVIEARSCERMKILSENLTDPELVRLYQGLLESEARHHSLYVELAQSVCPPDVVLDRLSDIMKHESIILCDPVTGPRMHN